MKECFEKLNGFRFRKELALEGIATTARRLVPTLKDHGLPETAKELDRLLFELDAIEGEMRNWTKQNIEEIIGALKSP